MYCTDAFRDIINQKCSLAAGKFSITVLAVLTSGGTTKQVFAHEFASNPPMNWPKILLGAALVNLPINTVVIVMILSPLAKDFNLEAC